MWIGWIAGHPIVHDRDRVPALVCSLKPSPAPSSSDLMARQVLAELAKHGVTGDVVRVVDHDVRPGVEIDMGDGDAWPAIREQLMAADILIVSTPTWVGHMSSVAQRVLERLDGELSETDDSGRPLPGAGRRRARRRSLSPGRDRPGGAPGGPPPVPGRGRARRVPDQVLAH